jgi:hypothetical protein
MTAWNEGDDGGTSLATDLVGQDLANAIADGPTIEEVTTLISGLTSLAGRLSIELERCSKVPIAEILQRAGRQAAE